MKIWGLVEDFTKKAPRNRRFLLFSNLPNYKLYTVAAACGYHLDNHHHALADAEACAWIAREIL